MQQLTRDNGTLYCACLFVCWCSFLS